MAQYFDQLEGIWSEYKVYLGKGSGMKHGNHWRRRGQECSPLYLPRALLFWSGTKNWVRRFTSRARAAATPPTPVTKRRFSRTSRNPRFLYASFARLSNLQLLDLLESLGCPMKVERGDRAFPASDKASDVTGALSRELRRLGVAVRFGARVESIFCENGRVAGVHLEGGESLALDAVVVATGGASYPSTGSTGDGYALARGGAHDRAMPARARAH